MKKLLTLLCFIALSMPCFAYSNAVIVESQTNFATNMEKSKFTLKVVRPNEFENGIIFEEKAIITGEVLQVISAQKLKRDGYFILRPLTYTVPSTGQTLNISESNWVSRVNSYVPFDKKNAALSAGLSVAGVFVKGASTIYHFGRGVVTADEDPNRLKSGMKAAYDNSPLAYVEEGQEVNVKQGDLLQLKFYYEDVPKWKYWDRNK